MWESIRAAVKANRLHALPVGGAPSQVPLSRVQLGIWMAHEGHRSSGAFHSEGRLRLRGPLNVLALEQAIRELGRRHQVLRTSLMMLDGEPHLCVATDELRLSSHWLEDERSGELNGRPAFMLLLDPLGPDDHLLVLRSHQLFLDAASWTVIFRELSALYSSFATESAIPLTEPPLDFLAYAKWHTEMTNAGAFHDQLEFWKSKLEAARPSEWPSLLNGRDDSATSGSVSLTMGARHVEAMKAIAEQLRTTQYAVVHALVIALEHRYKRVDDLILGISVAGRNRRQLRRSVGRYANTVPVRTALRGDWTFAELVRVVTSDVEAAVANQDIPLISIVESLRPPRTKSGRPWFNTMLAFSAHDESEFNGWHGLEVDWVERPDSALVGARADVDFRLRLYPDRCVTRLTHDGAVVDQATAAGMAHAFESLFGDALLNPDRQLRRLALSTVSRRAALSLAAPPNVQPSQGLLGSIEAQAIATPEADAIRHQEESLSYRGLMRRIREWRHLMASKGIRAGDAVAVLMDSELDLVPALLGIWAAGAICIPLEPGHPTSLLRAIISNAGVKIAVVGSRCKQQSFALSVPVVRLDELSSEQLILALPDYDAAAAAYVLYDCVDSTVPRGTCVRHETLANAVYGAAGRLNLGSADLVVASDPAFDRTLIELLAPLVRGAALWDCAPTATTARALSIELNKTPPSAAFLTASHCSELIEAGWCPAAGSRVIVMDDIPPLAVKKAMPASAALWTAYGNAACGGVAMLSPCGIEDSATLGECLPGVARMVLDEYNELVPVGVAGELQLEAPGVPGRIKTGLRCRYRRDGEIESLGRLDRVISMRGRRVNLEEIERVVRKCDGIDGSCALPTRNSESILLFVQGLNASAEWRLRKQLVANLPRFALPSRITCLAKIPARSNGEPDLSALLTTPEGSSDDGPPVDEGFLAIEEKVQKIWRAALQVRSIRRTDNFFDLGGSSLLALSVRTQMQAEVGVHVTAQSLLFDSFGQIIWTATHNARAEEPL